MSYTLVTETSFRSDAYVCPVCGDEAWSEGSSDTAKFLSCEHGHGWYYLETVTGPRALDTVGGAGTTGAGELGFWLPA